MLILELILSLMIWSMTFIPINSYILGLNVDLLNKIMKEESHKTIFEILKISEENSYGRSDLCDSFGVEDVNYNGISYEDILTKSTSTEVTSVISDGERLFIGLNSASSTDSDLIVYDVMALQKPIDIINSGPGILGLAFYGKNIFAINSSINSSVQRFKFNNEMGKLTKLLDYKIPWSSSLNPIYSSKISLIYPYLFVGLKKNINEELLAINLGKLDSGQSIQNSIDDKWEFNSSINALWPFYDGNKHIFVSTAVEPEIQDLCLDCRVDGGADVGGFGGDSSTSTATSSRIIDSFDILGSLGNVRSLIQRDDQIFVGRSSGNNELFRIKKDLRGYDLLESVDILNGVSSMILLGDYLILSTSKDASKIQIRKSEEISNLVKTIDTDVAVVDLECVRGEIYGVGNRFLREGDIVKNIQPVIFKLIK